MKILSFLPMTVAFALGVLSTQSFAQSSIMEKAATEWAEEVRQAAQRGTVAPYFIFRDLEIRAENSMLKGEPELKAMIAEHELAKEIASRSLAIFEKRALSKKELEIAELWALKSGKEVEKIKLKMERDKSLIEISRLNRIETTNGMGIGEKLPAQYLSVWGMECKIALLDLEIATAERAHAIIVEKRHQILFPQKGVSGFDLLRAMAALKKTEQSVAAYSSVVNHCRALELIPAE